jgi:5'-deoxynucleotidase YfbR-like HD superfamily hydrolase
MFEYLKRTLAHVPRWQLAPRIRTQSVAEHSYFVALYTEEICVLLAMSQSQTAECVRYALYHDIAEATTGDIPGPVKKAIVDPDKFAAYEKLAEQKAGLCDADDWGTEVKAIVKIADLIDEVFYLKSEEMLGNRTLKHALETSMYRFHNAVQLAPMSYDKKQTVLNSVQGQLGEAEGGAILPSFFATTDPLTPDTSDEIPF